MRRKAVSGRGAIVSLKTRLLLWFVKRQIDKRKKKEVSMDQLKTVLTWVFKMDIVPSGYLTLGAGWVGIILALACALGITIPGYSCPQDPVAGLVEGMAGLGFIGLGRRK